MHICLSGRMKIDLSEAGSTSDKRTSREMRLFDSIFIQNDQKSSFVM